MKIESRNKLILSLNVLWIFLLLLLGSWWLYLIISISNPENHLRLNRERFFNMLVWEGTTFFILMLLLSSSLFILYLRDQKKNKAMQAFFASLTHELKTPLASIRLQGEVINESAQDLSNEKLIKLTNRLIEDSALLENQMDKILHLSRIERGAETQISEINLDRFIKSSLKKSFIEVEFNSISHAIILGNESALEIIFKNLFENTFNYSEKNKKAKIQLSEDEKHITCLYQDNGTFEGNIEKLGELFYRANTKKGTGIGIYLIKNLTFLQKGQFKIVNSSPFTIELKFLKAKKDDA